MKKKNVFVSFDYDNDRNYRNLLSAWDANSDFEFCFNDKTPSEIQSYDIGRVKAALTTKINQATHTIVLIGNEINKKHNNSESIGHKNWQHFEINQSIANNNKMIYVKLDANNSMPNGITISNSRIVNSYSQDGIIKAIKEL